MAYKVINKFKDTDGHIYEIGKPYPHKGKPTKKRLSELTEKHPRYGVSFIEKIAEDKE